MNLKIPVLKFEDHFLKSSYKSSIQSPNFLIYSVHPKLSKPVFLFSRKPNLLILKSQFRNLQSNPLINHSRTSTSSSNVIISKFHQTLRFHINPKFSACRDLLLISNEISGQKIKKEENQGGLVAEIPNQLVLYKVDENGGAERKRMIFYCKEFRYRIINSLSIAII